MRQKGFVYLSILIVILVLGVLGYFIFNISQNTSRPNSSQIKENNVANRSKVINIDSPEYKKTLNYLKCGHVARSSSEIIDDICLFKSDYGANSQFSFQFPKEWKFRTVGANVDNVVLGNDEYEIFIGIAGWLDNNSDSVDDAYWQGTGETAEKRYVIPRDKPELSREALSLGHNEVTRLIYSGKTMYVMSDNQEEPKNVFRIEVNSVDPNVLKEVETIITSLRFEDKS